MPASKDRAFAFFYVVKNMKQKSLIPGVPEVIKETPIGECHITFRGRILCGESREVIKNREKGKPKDAKERPAGLKCCGICDTKWRENPESDYYRFVHGRDITNPATGNESDVREGMRKET